MSILELRGELEAEMAWRHDEIRFFQNQGADLDDEHQQEQYRRALILLLYAHFEGFCKFALTLYVNAVNQQGIKCAEANHAIAAASLSVNSSGGSFGPQCDAEPLMQLSQAVGGDAWDRGGASACVRCD